MILRVFNVLVFSLIAWHASGQYSVSGKIFSAEDSIAVSECTIHLDDGKRAAFADATGNFILENIASGSHVLHLTSSDFEYTQIPFVIDAKNASLSIYLKSNREILTEVMVTDARGDFGMARLRAVENLGIYEGKKTEVIIPEQLVANISANNARQVYSRVAGLNIWDNDGGGLQLSIGGRGLDPSRTSNFNTRQNGYDISADALGYPENYFTPPVEGIGKIQIVRGAASLQYGTQFGGLINFIMKSAPEDKKLELIARQAVGSFGFYNAFTSAGGTIKKLSYYSFFQYKRGDGWRNNSTFDNKTWYGNLVYRFNENTSVKLDYTHMVYLAQQPGGLSDQMFHENPRQTNRDRNWFSVDWNLYALHLDHKINLSTEINLRLFGLSASRYSVGYRPNRVATLEDPAKYERRDLIKGDFDNWGAEARFLKRYAIAKIPSVLLIGSRFYEGFNHSTQGFGSRGKDANFNYVDEDPNILSDYRFPNRNMSGFIENIFYINEKLSITPGARVEYLRTTSKGHFNTIATDLAGNVINVEYGEEYRNKPRTIFIAGIGVGYRPSNNLELYSNISQNYRSITFNDMRIVNPSSRIDSMLRDEKGYSLDIGMRSVETSSYTFDLSAFLLNYNNRIGETLKVDSLWDYKFRTNVGQALITGIEAYGEINLLDLWKLQSTKWNAMAFSNVALIHSRYTRSKLAGVKGKTMEFVPSINMKAGVQVGFQKLKTSFLYTYLSGQYSDATNSIDGGVAAVFGKIPAYYVMDVSLSYEWKKFKVEGSINNVTDNMYFTRRATGYPGPGILPADGRSFFLTLQARLGY
jgi:Fe(3+) dicitrate transport protein